ncbi:PAS domain S-box-containing protein/diguanylate cyclase (GGDEF)-like protein [Tahibacter aquaticus]|uniref:PAS domain S-box-containing protein/diguanylate cyclase (GGDEF)-like protein n=1 Tax=Tahibacter aquaticus TaxID=520092 RepID=A0A4R6Z0S8_9GAMM|nr:PAS domain S-box protein [Tahibacter aquaticus]TDR44979.1 PAS domain S-box-containing protein/diguanylate cyclase (GGDEF)-like protein [Tahibacter aquaticus]
MHKGVDIGLIGTAPGIRQIAAALADAANARVLGLGDLDNALQALEALSCDLLLVEATDPALPAYAQLRAVAPDSAWIALDRVDAIGRVPAWMALGAAACLALDRLDAELLQRSIAQVLAGRATTAALNAQRDDLLVLFERTPLPMWVFDTVTLRFLAVNDAAIRAYGYRHEEFQRLSLYDLRDPEEHAALELALSQPLPVQASASLVRHRAADGRPILVEISAQELRYGGRPARLEMARDVTAQRQAIRSIEASERRFRDLFEQSLGLICTHDMDGLLLSVNPAAANALGYRVAELVGRSMLGIIPETMQAHFHTYLKRIARNEADSGLFYVQHRDGEQRIWEYNNRVLRDEDGQPFVMGHSLDITEHRLYEHRLREQQAELEAVNDGSPMGLFRASLGGAWNYANRAFERMAGLRSDEARGHDWLRAVHPDDRARVTADWQAAVQHRQRFQSRLRFRHDSNHTVWVAMQAAPLVVEGEITGYAGSIEDISARHLAEEQLRRNEQRLRTITDALPAMIAYVDAAQRYQFANVAYEQAYAGARSLVGRHARQVLGEDTYLRRQPHIEQALHGVRVTFEDEDEREDGSYVCLELTYIPQWDEERRQVLGVHVMAQDITRQKVEEKRWIQAAERDSLTGLSNRAGFLVRLERALARSRDQRSLLVVLYLDIDRFKQINDSHGHAVGDEVLRIFAQRLGTVLRPSDVIARLGGDEFTVIIEGMRRSQYASAAAAKIVAAMRKPFLLEVQGLSLSVSTSVGVALAQNEAQLSVAQLLERADGALYEAKSAGRDGYRVRAGDNAEMQKKPTSG